MIERLPDDLRVKFDELPEGELGRFTPKDDLVRVSRAALDPERVLTHEEVHVLRNNGLFTDQEWNILTRKAEPLVQEAQERYAEKLKDYHPDEVRDVIQQEAVAKLRELRLKGESFGKRTDTLLNRIGRFFESLRNYLHGNGWQTLEDVHKAIDSGEIGQRPVRKREASVESFHSLDNESFLKDDSWAAVREEDAPRGAGGLRVPFTDIELPTRFDRAAFSTRSRNVAERLVGPRLLNESVGMEGHATTPFSADQVAERLHNVNLTRWNRVVGPAYDKWAKDMGLSMIQKRTSRDRFFTSIGDCIRDYGRKPGDYHPEVEKLAQKASEIFGDILDHLKNPLKDEGLVGRPIKGSENIDRNDHYLTRLFDDAAVRTQSDTRAFGVEGVTKMIAGAIRSAQPHLPLETAERIAKGYFRNIRNRAFGLDDEWGLAMNGDQDALRSALKNGCGMPDLEVEQVLDRLSPRGEGKPDMASLKHRVLLDETHVESLPHGTLGTASLAFRDLLERNADTLLQAYSRRASGRIALGKVRISTADGGLLVDGITSDAEANKLLDNVQRYGLDHGQAPDQAQASRERLQFAIDRIKGIPDPQSQTPMARWMRILKSYTTTTLMGQVGIAQFGEAGTPVGVLGLRAAMQHSPALKRMVTDLGENVPSEALKAELEAVGLGAGRLHGSFFFQADDPHGLPYESSLGPLMDRLERTAKAAENATYELSLNNAIQQRQELWAGSIMAQRLADMAEKIKAGTPLDAVEVKRIAQLGIDKPMMDRISGQMKAWADKVEGYSFDGKLNSLHLDKWDDLQARTALENAVFRMTRKLIQTGDLGSAALWMSSPTAQLIFQFRGFGFTAWANQFQYQLHVAPAHAVASFMMSMAWNAVVRAAQVSLLSVGRSDQDKYLKKQLDTWELGKAGFQRGGWSSIIPMGIDTTLGLLGQPQQFTARSSGQPSSAFGGSPFVGLYDKLSTGMQGLLGNHHTSQFEMRQLFGVLPFSNLLPMTVGLNALVHDLPVRPKRDKVPNPFK